MINQMSSSMRNFMEAYSAVHNKEAKEEFYSHKDEISEMDFSLINQTELDDIAEEVLEELFEEGYSVEQCEAIFEEFLTEARVTYGSDTESPRAKKMSAVKSSLKGAMGKVKEKAAKGAVKSYGAYRSAKQSATDKANRLKQSAGNASARTVRKAKDAKAGIKSGIKGMIGKAANKVGSAANKVASRMSEHNIKQDIADIYRTIYEKKADKDYDGDGKVESSKDEWKGSKDKAIKKAKGKDENPAEEEEELRKDDDLFGSPNKKKKKVNEAQEPEVAPTGASRRKKKSYDPASDEGIDNSTGKKVGRVQAESQGYNTYGAADPKMHAKQMKAMAGASNSTGDRQKAKAATMRPAKNKIAAKSAMGESQGYNDRLDDSLGAKNGKKSQSKKDRRDESEGMEKSMGKRKYSGDKSMDEAYGTGAAMIRGGGKPKKKVDVFAYDRKIGKKTLPDGRPLPPAPKSEGVVWSQSELDAINAKIDAWNEEGPAYPYETKAQAKAQKDHRKGKSSKGIKTGVNAPNYETSRTSGANRQD